MHDLMENKIKGIFIFYNHMVKRGINLFLTGVVKHQTDNLG